ncbi:MAG: hypothetical protein WC119_01625 [Synergistaceae bacterium]
MEKVEYVKGDATDPQGEGRKLIVHCCNDIGAWGKGFVISLSKKWEYPEIEYRKWFKNGKNFELGNIQAVRVDKEIAVINMIGQHHIKTLDGVPPIRYKAIEKCLTKVADLAEKYGASIHAPKFGSGLAGGEWKIIEGMLQELVCSRDIPITVYEYD